MKNLLILFLIICPFFCLSQTKKWHPFLGVYASMDGGGYYFGSSFQLGVDYSLTKKISLSVYIHYFPSKVNENYSDGSFENGEYKSTIATLLVQKKLSKKQNKGLFLGLGFSVQRTSENYISDIDELQTKRTIGVAAIRFGYLFPLEKKNLSLELNAVGPHKSTTYVDSYKSDEIEFLTQLSLGIRLVF